MPDTSAVVLSGAVPVRRTHLRVIGAVVLADLVGLTIVVVSRPRSGLAQTVGDLSQLAAVLLAVAGCVGAARRGGPDRRAWAVLASALGVWAMAMTLWTWYGLTRDHVYPFPSLADLGFVGYAVPAVAALLLFPRSSLGRASRLRELLDAAVIAGSVLFVSWATVLGPLYQSGGTGLTRLVGLAYPVADIAVASVVLVLGMRVPPEQRRPWLLFGGGLVLLTVTDSAFVSMTLRGQTGATGTPLVLGWVAAMVLIAAASQVRPRRARPSTFRNFTLLQELLPTLALAGAIAVAVARRAGHWRRLPGRQCRRAAGAVRRPAGGGGHREGAPCQRARGDHRASDRRALLGRRALPFPGGVLRRRDHRRHDRRLGHQLERGGGTPARILL